MNITLRLSPVSKQGALRIVLTFAVNWKMLTQKMYQHKGHLSEKEKPIKKGTILTQQTSKWSEETQRG